jgi:hypothetical protein
LILAAAADGGQKGSCFEIAGWTIDLTPVK